MTAQAHVLEFFLNICFDTGGLAEDGRGRVMGGDKSSGQLSTFSSPFRQHLAYNLSHCMIR
jgi:hypothetical protein